MQKQKKAVFTIIEGDKLNKHRRIGTAFVNRDQSLNVILDALPMGGKLIIRDALPPKEGQKEAA